MLASNPPSIADKEVAKRNMARSQIFLGKRFGHELFWVRHQPFLLSRGYELRPRYDPDWVPTWRRLGQPIEHLNNFEDAVVLGSTRLIDAICVHDGRKVVLKRVETSSQEIPIARFLSSSPRESDQRNNAVPILDIILLPEDDTQALLVMPLLFPFHILPFRRVSEFVVLMRQTVQGLQYMHEQNISHRDACWGNIMMDVSQLLPEGFHFDNPYSRDGITRWHQWPDRGSDKSLRIRMTGIVGQDRTVPEMSRTVFYDPFKMDIYQLGNVFRDIIKDHTGLEVVQGIVNAMTNQNPDDRPSLSRVLHKLDRLHWWQLRRRVWHKDSFLLERILVGFFGLKTL